MPCKHRCAGVAPCIHQEAPRRIQHPDVLWILPDWIPLFSYKTGFWQIRSNFTHNEKGRPKCRVAGAPNRLATPMRANNGQERNVCSCTLIQIRGTQSLQTLLVWPASRNNWPTLLQNVILITDIIKPLRKYTWVSAVELLLRLWPMLNFHFTIT
jgi:hypothetical protein